MFKIMNIFTTPALKVLIFLGRNYRNSYYVRELAAELSISTGSASGQLRALKEAGLVTCEQKGRTLLFRAAISHPLVREVKIVASLAELSPLIAARDGGIVRMILFGSCATGEDAAESDIDLYIETSDREQTQELLSRVGPSLPRKLSSIVVTANEAAQLRARDRPLYERIRSGKVLAGEAL
jgi:predicted nucleotidyltransferase